MSIESSKEIKVGMVAWGLKNGYQIFFNSPHIDVKSTEIRRTLEDVRVLVNFTSVDLKFYSLEWTEDYKVFTSYLALYDWSNRKNAYLAMSLFVPHDQRMSDGALGLVDQLTETYRDKYIGEDFKIKRVNEDEAHFFGLVSSAPVLPDAKRKRPNRPQNAGYGLVRYQNEEDLKGFFKNSYLKEYEDYKEIFFLPAEQNRLNPSSVIKPVTTKDGQPLTPQPLSFPVSVKPVLPGVTGPIETGKVVVKMNGLTTFPDDEGVYTREFPRDDEQVKVEVEYKGDYFLPKTVNNSRKIFEWGTDVVEFKLEKKPPPPPKQVYKPEPKKGTGNQAKQHGNGKKVMDFGSGNAASGAAGSLPENSKFWSKENRMINGAFTLEIYLKDNETKHAISTTQGKHVKLNVTNLGGAFYSSSPVIRLTGLSVGDVLEGLIDADGYRTKTFNYTVRPAAGSAISVLEPQTVIMDRLKTPAAAGGAGAAGTRPKDNGGDSSEGLAQWMKILIAVLIAIVVCALAYLAYDFLTKPDGGIKEEERSIAKKDFEQDYLRYVDSLNAFVNEQAYLRDSLGVRIAKAKALKVDDLTLNKGEDLLRDISDLLGTDAEIEMASAKGLALKAIDTSSTMLPEKSNLLLFLNKPFEAFEEKIDRIKLRYSNLKTEFNGAIYQGENLKKEEDEKIKRAQAKAREAIKISKSSTLYPVKFYDDWIFATKQGEETINFSGDERRRTRKKLELMKEISRLNYNAVNNVDGEKVNWINQLENKLTDASLEDGQKAMIRQKIGDISL